MHRLAALLALFILMGASARAEESLPVLIDRTNELTEEYTFPADTPVLEIVFPRVYSSDCAIVRFGYDVMMIDASAETNIMQRRVQSALTSMGVDYIDIAFNSHPHHDHINGFSEVVKNVPIGRLVLTFEEDYNSKIIRVTKDFNARAIPVEHAGGGDVFYLGAGEDVTVRVLQRNDSGAWSGNDRSAMLHIQYGERSILFAADIELPAQRSYGTNPPDGGIQADILKYPHHGKDALDDAFLRAVSPSLCILTSADKALSGGKQYLHDWGIPYLLAFTGLIRLRTDGKVWVVDYLHEVSPDRETINPNYR